MPSETEYEQFKTDCHRMDKEYKELVQGQLNRPDFEIHFDEVLDIIHAKWNEINQYLLQNEELITDIKNSLDSPPGKLFAAYHDAYSKLQKNLLTFRNENLVEVALTRLDMIVKKLDDCQSDSQGLSFEDASKKCNMGENLLSTLRKQAILSDIPQGNERLKGCADRMTTFKKYLLDGQNAYKAINDAFSKLQALLKEKAPEPIQKRKLKKGEEINISEPKNRIFEPRDLNDLEKKDTLLGQYDKILKMAQDFQKKYGGSLFEKENEKIQKNLKAYDKAMTSVIFFGSDQLKMKGMFAVYLDQRAKTFAKSDAAKKGFSLFSFKFYTPGANKRKAFIAKLRVTADLYADGSLSSEALKDIVAEARVKFPSRKHPKPGEMTLNQVLDDFVKAVDQIEAAAARGYAPKGDGAEVPKPVK